ncbi:MAG: hypothetical protein ACE5EE_06530 [Fidelibacterota bacterium]
MIRRLIATILFCLTFAFAGDIGGYAGGFLRLGTTARSMALGGGLTASLDPGWAAFHNPASLVFLEKRHVSMFHHFLPLDRDLISATAAVALPPSGGLGLGVLRAGVDNIDGRDASGHQTGTLSAAEYAIIFSFANEIMEGISIGVNVKLLYQFLPLDSKGQSRGTGFDIGLIVRRFPKMEFGLVLQDLSTAFNWNTAELFGDEGRTYQDKLPMWIRAGMVYHLRDIDVIGDYSVISDWKYSTAHRIRAGAEFMVNPRVALRAGIDNFMPAAGAGLNYSLIKRDDSIVDYAFVLGKRGEGISHVFTYVFTF